MTVNTAGIHADISQETANRAHYGTSFSPEKRGAAMVTEYTRTMQSLAAYIDEQAKDERQQEVAQEIFDRLRAKYRVRTQAWIGAKSRCISSMITGPSNFPVRRAEKANASEHNRYTELATLEKAMFRYVDKALASVYSRAEKTLDELGAMKEKLAKAEAAQEFMKAANALHRKKDTAALEALFAKKYGNGSAMVLSKFLSPNYMGAVGFERWEMSNNLANIKRMKERVTILERKTQAAETEAKETELAGLTIVRNAAEDRLQLIFDGKPGEDERTLLKSNGFKWSPRFGAWQRQLTGNAEYALKQYVLGNALFAKYAAAPEPEATQEPEPEPAPVTATTEAAALPVDLPAAIAPARDVDGISKRAAPLQSDLVSPLMKAQRCEKAQAFFGFDADSLPLFQSESR